MTGGHDRRAPRVTYWGRHERAPRRPRSAVPAPRAAAPVQASPFDWVLAGSRGRPTWERVTGAAPPVGHVRLDPPGDDAALMAAVSRLHGPHVRRDGMLWECHLIEGLRDDRFALYYKMHHACIDGVSAIRRLERALSTDPAQATPPILS
ncbi:MAG: hypothetical protein K8M05_36850, partial [Deltaproteobacteria bacterium]|nr:hypothetical protein [Kofleriaceae bacterium]